MKREKIPNIKVLKKVLLINENLENLIATALLATQGQANTQVNHCLSRLFKKQKQA